MYLDVFFSGFAGALSSFGFSQVPSLPFLSKVYVYVLLKAYLLSRCCFSEFAGALTSFGFSYGPRLFFSVQSRYVLLKAYLLSRCI